MYRTTFTHVYTLMPLYYFTPFPLVWAKVSREEDGPIGIFMELDARQACLDDHVFMESGLGHQR